MGSHLTQLYDKIVSQCIAKAEAGLRIKTILLADYWAIGPELGDRIARMGPQEALNAVVIAPLEPTEGPGDAQKRTRQVVQPFDIFYIYKREGTELRDVIEQWADPLHDILCAEQVRRLGVVSLTDSRGKAVGKVVGWDVGLPSFDIPDNDALYPMGLAAFAIRVEVSYVAARDSETTLTGRV